MGCDIHMFVEKLNPETKEWEFQDPPSIELYKTQDGTPVMADYWYWGRNYDLFAVLANVRNGFGFAGVYTGEPLEYIEEPRGIPEDASPEYAKIAGPYTPCGDPCEGYELGKYDECTAEHGWGEDGHSHSWFTLRELVHTPLWDQEQIKGGVVSAADYIRWRDEGSPHTWSGGISGPGIEIVEPAEMERRLATGEADPNAGWPEARTYTNVRWKTTLRDSLGSDWFAFLDKLKHMTLDDGSDVRCVFFFDN